MDVEKIFWVAQILMGIIFAIGAAGTLTVWFKGASLPASIRPNRGKRILRSLVVQGWFNQRLFKTDRTRWAAHFLMLNGTLILMSLSAFSVLFTKLLPHFPGVNGPALIAAAGRDQPVKAILNETGSLMLTAGWLFYAVRRYVTKPAQLRSNARDALPILGLGLILLTGWALEAARINAAGIPSPVSYIGYPLARALSGLPLTWGSLFNGLYLFHGLLATLVVATFPYSKWIHTVAAGVSTALADAQGGAAFPSLRYSRRQLVELDACTRCGECIPGCPTYTEKPGSMAITPLNKIDAVRRSKGNLPAENTREHIRGVFDCTLCGRCAAVCPTHIQTRDLWLAMRASIHQSGTTPEAVLSLKTTLARTHNLTGDESNDRAAWGQNLDQPVPAAAPGKPVDLLYFTGCVSAQYPQAFSIPQAVVRLLRQSGSRFGVLGNEEWCCGFPLLTAGFGEETVILARHNLEAVRRSGAKTLLTGCPSCYRMWKETYPALLGEEPGFEVVHAVTWLEDQVLNGRLKLKPYNRVVTYHDPCDLGRGSGIYDEPRRILQAVPGLQLVEMPHNRKAAWCCGGGGDVEMVDGDLTKAVAFRRIQEAASSGADTLITACQQCVRALSTASRNHEAGVKVNDILPFIERLVDN